ncbi:MAG: RnfABCDGE type electron transport complex subunit B [Oscillospiraceae bacterium]|nr:RnfABCDGE type electron transport complex subunit B [Oscillospiraceae bacterium]
MVIEYIIPVIIFLAVGGAAGAALTFASKAFEVELDETVDRILEQLPGINCGACGMASCEDYAEAVKSGNAEPNLCKPGGPDAAKGIGMVLGIEVKPQERETAFVHCAGITTEDKYRYNGTQTCAAARRYYKGRINCESGCLGYGDCAKVCGYDAIRIENNVAVVDPQKCWACGMCVSECPNKIITLRKHSERIKVKCSSKDTALLTKANCKHGCMGCGLCAKKCMKDAIKVVDNCAVIDYDICTFCGVCAMVCPAKCITVEERKRRAE